MQNPNNMTGGPFPGGGDETLRTIRHVGAGVGLVLIVVGVFLVGTLYLRISSWIQQPSQFEPYLDQWERVVGGASPLFVCEPSGRKLPTSGSDRATSDHSSPVHLPSPETIKVNIARPIAAGTMLLLTGVLVSLAVGIINAGGRLVAMSMPDRDVIRKVIREMTSTRS